MPSKGRPKFTFRLDGWEHEALMQYAQQNNTTAGDLMRDLMHAFFATEGIKRPDRQEQLDGQISTDDLDV